MLVQQQMCYFLSTIRLEESTSRLNITANANLLNNSISHLVNKFQEYPTSGVNQFL